MGKQLTTVYLRQFGEAELLFDDRETKDVFRFFFQADRSIIETMQITNELRNFAQALLVAAIDASYAMGWMEVVFRSTASRGEGLKKTIQKLGVRGGRHWFKHLRNGQSLRDAKIYESVRNQLTRNFRSAFRVIMLSKGPGKKQQFAASMHCAPPAAHDKLWA